MIYDDHQNRRTPKRVKTRVAPNIVQSHSPCGRNAAQVPISVKESAARVGTGVSRRAGGWRQIVNGRDFSTKVSVGAKGSSEAEVIPLTGAQKKEVKLSVESRALVDGARGLSALYVVAHHLAQQSSLGGVPGFVLRFGQEAVLVFFVLSGFLIFANEKDRSQDFVGFYKRRLLRVYPTLLAAMMVSVFIALANEDLADRFKWSELFYTVLSVQDLTALKPGVISDPFMGNSPLWSLSYEVFFYAIFPAVMLGWRKRPTLVTNLIGISGCIAYVIYAVRPNHWALMLAYFPIWWAGAMVANAYAAGNRRIDSILMPTFWLLVLALTSTLVMLGSEIKSLGTHPVLPVRHFAATLVVLWIGFGPIGEWASKILVRWRVPLSWLASISFGLYVFHVPLLIGNVAPGIGGWTIRGLALLSLAIVFDRGVNRFISSLRKQH